MSLSLISPSTLCSSVLLLWQILLNLQTVSMQLLPGCAVSQSKVEPLDGQQHVIHIWHRRFASHNLACLQDSICY